MPIFSGCIIEEVTPHLMDSRRQAAQSWAREANEVIGAYRRGQCELEAFAHLPSSYGPENRGDLAEWASGPEGAIVNLLAYIRDCPEHLFDFKIIPGSHGSNWCDIWLPGHLRGAELIKFARVSAHGYIGGVLNLIIDATFSRDFALQELRDRGQAYRVYDPVGDDSDEDYGTAPGSGTGAGGNETQAAPPEEMNWTPEDVSRALAAAYLRHCETGVSTMMDIDGTTYCIGTRAQVDAMKAFRRANPDDFAALASIEHPAGHVEEFLQDIEQGTGLMINMLDGTADFVDNSEQ
jgi:hypothetical protein